MPRLLLPLPRLPLPFLQEFSAAAAQKGAHMLEAPITGGLEALKKGRMVVHVGGDEEVARAVNPILEVRGSEGIMRGNEGK